MACAASTSDKYSDMHDVFYQRARRYAEMDEMKVIFPPLFYSFKVT
jgi:hypothetical protein